MGELRALDLGDRPRAYGPAIHFVYCPDKGTPLKNKKKSERWNAISGHVAQTLKVETVVQILFREV